MASLAAGARVAAQGGFDHSHAAWTVLLRRHVVLLRGGQASQLRYAGIAAERVALKAYLATLSAVPRPAFEAFAKPQRQAFLINAYNAFTVELILTRYPGLKSIRACTSASTAPASAARRCASCRRSVSWTTTGR